MSLCTERVFAVCFHGWMGNVRFRVRTKNLLILCEEKMKRKETYTQLRCSASWTWRGKGDSHRKRASTGTHTHMTHSTVSLVTSVLVVTIITSDSTYVSSAALPPSFRYPLPWDPASWQAIHATGQGHLSFTVPSSSLTQTMQYPDSQEQTVLINILQCTEQSLLQKTPTFRQNHP